MKNGIKDFFFDSKAIKQNWRKFFALFIILGTIDVFIKILYVFYFSSLDLSIIGTTIMPLKNKLHESFFELYSSQISITFIVTSLLSIFGGNEELIYWENAIDYKLIKPAGKSFKDITAYCIGTLVVSLIAIIFKLSILFLGSFFVNILGLIIITINMLTIFFRPDKVQKNLKNEFITEEKKEEKIYLLEANTYKHIKNYDLNKINDNIDFLIEQITNSQNNNEMLFDSLMRIYREIPDVFFNLKFKILIVLFSRLQLGYETEDVILNDNEEYKKIIKRKILDAIKLEGEDVSNKSNKKENIDRIMSFTEKVYKCLEDNASDRKFFLGEEDKIIRVYEALLVEQIIDKILELIDTKWVYSCNDVLDFSKYFIKIINLIKIAYQNSNDITPYMCLLESVSDCIYTGLVSLERAEVDPVSRAKKYYKSRTILNSLPDSICRLVSFYNEETAVELFKIICSDDSVMSDREGATSFLESVYYYTSNLNDDNKEHLTKLVYDSSLAYKAYLLSLLDSKYSFYRDNL